MRQVRLIATDLDGTLVGDGYRISRRTARVLDLATSRGITVVLVTGRPVRWLPVVYQQLDGPYPAVCANGAATYDPRTDAIVEVGALSPDTLAEVCSRLSATVPGIRFAAEVDGGRRLLHEPDWPLRWDAEDPAVTAVPVGELVRVRAVKLLARDRDRDPDQFTALVHEAVGDLVETTHSSYTGLVEMSALGVTKASGLATLAAMWGIGPDEVVAFGDMPNDVPMLRWAGCGVAMGNAHPAARAAAGAATAANTEDGVAVYLERLLGCGSSEPAVGPGGLDGLDPVA